MADTTFELDEIPGVLFTASYGSGGVSGLPSNWVRIVGTTPGAPTDDNPDPEPAVVLEVGFVGPSPAAPSVPAETEPTDG